MRAQSRRSEELSETEIVQRLRNGWERPLFEERKWITSMLHERALSPVRKLRSSARQLTDVNNQSEVDKLWEC
jgi:hypothetical protein